jgi:hypothetical protein
VARDVREAAAEINGQLRRMPRVALHSAPVQFAVRCWRALRCCDYHAVFGPTLW